MTKDQRITLLVLVAAVLTFAVAEGTCEYRLLARGDIQVPNGDGWRPITIREAQAEAGHAALRCVPYGVVGCVALLTLAWPFASFYRQGPREVAALAGCLIGAPSGCLFCLAAGPLCGMLIPFLFPAPEGGVMLWIFPYFVPAALAGAVLFGTLATVLPRRELGAPARASTAGCEIPEL